MASVTLKGLTCDRLKLTESLSPAVFEIFAYLDLTRMTRIHVRFERNISKTAGDRDSVSKDHQQEMANGISNVYEIDDVTWP